MPVDSFKLMDLSTPEGGVKVPGFVLQNLSVSFTDQRRHSNQALRDLNIQLPANQIIGVIGPSGCGKTTLLKAAAGLLNFETAARITGSIAVLGMSPDRLRAMRCGAAALQSGGLLPWLSVIQNVLFPIRVHRTVIAEDEDRADEILATMLLSERRNSFPTELSGGMQQRVAFARILMADPQVITCDEPLSSVDQITRDNLLSQLLRTFRERVLTPTDGRERICLWATHSLEEIALVADCVLILSRHPGTILRCLKSPLPVRRDLTALDHPDFFPFLRQMRSELN